MSMWYIIVATAIVCAYAMLVYRLQRFALLVRDGMGTLADRLLDNPDISEERKEVIEFEMANCQSSIIAWTYAIFLIPAAVVAALQNSVFKNVEYESDKLPVSVGEDLNRFTGLSILSSLLNSPLALFIFAVQLLLIMITAFPIYRTSELLQRYILHFLSSKSHTTRHARS